MSHNKAPKKVQTPAAVESKQYFTTLFDHAATVYFAITVVILPMFMWKDKYTAITAAKSTFFSVSSIIMLLAAIMLLLCMFMYTTADSFSAREKLTLRQRLERDPMLLADGSIIVYWILMFFSCITCDNVHTALYGLDPRNNGFFYQTLYVAAYFIISRGMKPARWKAMLFVWGGTILAVATILHYFGADLYDVVHYQAQNSSGEWVDKTLSPSYAGPFWNSSSYRFLGPVGNVNLGSYILSVALVLAAGFYITNIQPKYHKWQDKSSISLIVCFVILLYAELNINTDAGLVAMAAAVVAIPVVLCGSLERLSRALVIFAAASGTTLISHVIDRTLCEKSIGTTGKALILLTVLLAGMAAAAMVLKKKDKLKKAATPARMRIVLSSVVALAIICGLSLALIITEPDDPSAGALSGATVVLQSVDLNEKSDTIIHELGQILRGNLDDSFGHNRLFTWKRTLSLIRYNPILGIGPDNFKTFFASYYKAEAVEMFPSSNGNLDKAHNEFLDVLISNGILGFAAFMLFFGALLWCCFKKPDRLKYAPVLGVAVVSYMAHAFFGYQLPIQSPVMWMMIGAAAAYARHDCVEAPKTAPRKKPRTSAK